MGVYCNGLNHQSLAHRVSDRGPDNHVLVASLADQPDRSQSVPACGHLQGHVCVHARPNAQAAGMSQVHVLTCKMTHCAIPASVIATRMLTAVYDHTWVQQHFRAVHTTHSFTPSNVLGLILCHTGCRVLTTSSRLCKH